MTTAARLHCIIGCVPPPAKAFAHGPSETEHTLNAQELYRSKRAQMHLCVRPASFALDCTAATALAAHLRSIAGKELLSQTGRCGGSAKSRSHAAFARGVLGMLAPIPAITRTIIHRV